MAFIGNGVEYGLHCLLWLVSPHRQDSVSSRDLADLQGVSPSFVAKIFPKLEKAGIVRASEGIHGGYQLARAPAQITVLSVIDAIEGQKSLFDCQEIRSRCALYGGKQPSWSSGGVCAIHAVMIRAEQKMREELARTTVADLASALNRKAPLSFPAEIQGWFAKRLAARSAAKTSPPAVASKRRRRVR